MKKKIIARMALFIIVCLLSSVVAYGNKITDDPKSNVTQNDEIETSVEDSEDSQENQEELESTTEGRSFETGEINNATVDKANILELVTRLLEKQLEDITYHDVLYSVKEDEIYEIISFTSGGYAIFRNNPVMILEHSEEMPFHPYSGVEDRKKYYAGPLTYFGERDGFAVSTQDANIEIILSDYNEIETMIADFAERMGYKVQEGTGRARSNFAPQSLFTMEKVMASEEVIKRLPFGDNISSENVDGTCGIVATAMLLTYENMINPSVLPVNTIPRFHEDDKRGNSQSQSNRQNILHKHLNDQYAHKKISGGTVASIDAEMVNNFLGKESRNSNVHAVAGLATSKNICDAIDANRPVAVYGFMPNSPNVSRIPSGLGVAHAVVAYGYRLNLSGLTELKVHYGWHGINYIENDYSVNQRAYDVWISPFTIAGAVWLERTPAHIHESYIMDDIEVDYRVQTRDKFGNKLFSCTTPKCNALIPDDYGNTLKTAELIELNKDETTEYLVNTVKGKVNYKQDIDYFKITIPHTGKVTMEFEFDKAVGARHTVLLNSAGRTVATGAVVAGTNNKSRLISDFLVAPGDYYIYIQSANEDSYEFSIQMTSKDDHGDTPGMATGLLFLPERMFSGSGVINYKQDVDYFKITIPHKGKVTVEFEFDKAIGVQNALLLNSRGVAVATGAVVAGTNNKSRLISDFLVDPGDYYIYIQSANEDSYEFSIQMTSKDDHGDTPGMATGLLFLPERTFSGSGVINYKQDVDYFKITIPHKGRVMIHFEFDKAVGAQHTVLLNSAGRTVATGAVVAGTNNKSRLISNFSADPGDYYTYIQSANEDNYKFSVQLLW